MNPDPLKDIGGEPLEGSGHEDDVPDPEFSDDDTQPENLPPAQRD
jgi:hypothetical protein